MSDRYKFDEERGEMRSEREMALTQWHAERKLAREKLSLDISKAWTTTHANVYEREQCNRDTPLSLSQAQRDRLWSLLKDEVGPLSASKLLERIEKEV